MNSQIQAKAQTKFVKAICSAAFGIALICAGCRSPQHSETAEMSQMMQEQMKALRAQLAAQGATAEQLREFDRQVAELKKSMRHVERQLSTFESENAH